MSGEERRHPERVDAVALRRFLDGEHRQIREMIRGVISRPEFTETDWPLVGEEYRAQVLEWMRLLSSSGGTAMGFPSEFGGLDRVGGAVASFETLAHSDLSLLVKVGVQFGLFGGAVLHLGTRKHHERYLREITSLELPGCFAMSESRHGSDVQEVRTTATYDGEAGEFVVDTPNEEDCKDYIGNAARDGRMAAVFAQLVVGGESRGVHALLVPLRDEDGNVLEGVRIEDDGPKIGLNGVDNGRIWFDSVRVERDALLDRYAEVTPEGEYVSPIENRNRRFFTMLGTLIQGRVSVGGASISATKSALTIAVRHALRRRQFGPPDSEEEVLLLDYRVHQRRLLPALAKTYALHFTQESVLRELDRIFGNDLDEEEARRELETRAAGLKAIATWHATSTIQACREACGGLGYLAENRLGELKNDTEVFTTFEGDNTILLQLVAKSLLTGFSEHFGELDQLGTAQFVAAQVWETAVERTAIRELIQRLSDDLIPGRESEEDLGDREYQLGLFRWREDHVISTAARRIRGGIEAGIDAFEVFNLAQDHVLEAARAHVDREILEAFTEGIERCEDGNHKLLLNRVCDLYALSTIESERAWYQEHGRISSTRSKALIKTVNDLCGELRPYAFDLVDAFGIPDAVLAAPIGLPGGEASRTSSMQIDDPSVNVRELLEEKLLSAPADA